MPGCRTCTDRYGEMPERHLENVLLKKIVGTFLWDGGSSYYLVAGVLRWKIAGAKVEVMRAESSPGQL